MKIIKMVGGDSISPIFYYFLEEKKISLGHWNLTKTHFQLDFSFGGWDRHQLGSWSNGRLEFQSFGGGDPHQLGSWSDGRLEFQSSLEEPTGISQNTFHGM